MGLIPLQVLIQLVIVVQRKAASNVGPSGVRALPLAAGINVVAIILGIIFLSSFFLLSPLLFHQKGGR